MFCFGDGKYYIIAADKKASVFILPDRNRMAKSGTLESYRPSVLTHL